MRRMMLAGLITALPFALIAGAAAREKGATLRVEGLVTRPGTYTTSQLSALKRHTIKVDDHGTPAVYEGVSLTEVLALAGAPVGDEMRGSKLSLVVVAKAGRLCGGVCAG